MDTINIYFKTFEHAKRSIRGLIDEVQRHGAVTFSGFLELCRPGSIRYDLPVMGFNCEWRRGDFDWFMVRATDSVNAPKFYIWKVVLPMPHPLSLDSACMEEIKFKPALSKADKDAKIQKAYNVLTKALFRKDTDEDDLAEAMEEAIRYLGEVLE